MSTSPPSGRLWRHGARNLRARDEADNGDIPIAESEAGRAFEVDRGGSLVWEYGNRFDARRNLLVSDALWLPLDFFEPDALRCRGSAAEAPVSDRDDRR